MNSQQTTGIILKKIPYSEKDLIVVWLAEEGRKMKGFVPAGQTSLKRFGGALDLFNKLDLVYYTGRKQELVTLQNATLLTGHESIREDLSKFAVACYISEVILEFMQEEQNLPAVYQACADFFKELDSSDALKPHLVPLMEHRLLSLFGFQPSLSSCHLCRADILPGGNYFFDGRHGGIVCSDCVSRGSLESYPLNYDMLNQLLASVDGRPENWSSSAMKPNTVVQARKAFEYFIQYTAGKPFKSLRFLSQILS